MSNEQSKLKNSTRRYRDEVAVKKQTRIAKQHTTTGYESKTLKEPHRFNKHHAMDCGNPECFLCGNPRKTHKDKLTPQEKKLFQDLDNVPNKHSNGIPDPDETE